MALADDLNGNETIFDCGRTPTTNLGVDATGARGEKPETGGDERQFAVCWRRFSGGRAS